VRIPASISLTPAADTLAQLGDTLRLTATVIDAAGDPIADAPVTWASLDTLLARVDRYGRVTARDTGSARIVASSGAFADTAIVVVAPPATAPSQALRSAADAGGGEPIAAAAVGEPAAYIRRSASRRAGRRRSRFTS
jgi:uncharacterized protein YjdB